MEGVVVQRRSSQHDLIRSLREENAKLQESIQQTLASRAAQQPGTQNLHAAQEDQLQEEQLRKKDQRITELRAEIQATKDRAQQQTNPWRTQVQELETQHAALKVELQQARAAGFEADVGLLAADVRRAEESFGQLQAQLQRLVNNPFISKTDHRREANARVAQLEQLIQQKTAEHQQIADVHMKSEQARIAALHDRQRLETRCRDLQGRNERLQLDLEAQANEIKRVETEMRLLRERVPQESQEALERALQSLATGEAAAFTRVEQRGRDHVPSNQDLLSGDSMQRILDRLGQERGQLEDQIRVLRAELDRESGTSRNLKALQLQELEDVRQKSRGYILDRQKWERIAAAHLQTIKDLQNRIAGLDALAGGLGDSKDDAASSAGFSDLSELEGFENAMDVFVGKGEINSSALSSLEALLSAGGLSPDQVRSLVCLEIKGFSAGFSSVSTGLKPSYESLISFGPFATSQDWYEYMASGHVGLELRGCLPLDSNNRQHLLGCGRLPLAGLLQYPPEGLRNPVVSAIVPISDPSDVDIIVARLRVKLRLRYPVRELVEEYQHRLKVQQIDKDHLGRSVDPNLPGVPRRLCVQVRRAAGLPPAPRQLPEQLRPYVSFEVPGHAAQFTKTGAGPHPVFDEEAVLPVEVDGKFCTWAESGGGLHFVVFDHSAALPNPTTADERALGLLGELRVSLRPLLHNALAVVEGSFTLRRALADPAAPAMGTLDLQIFWQDFAAQRTVQATPAAVHQPFLAVEAPTLAPPQSAQSAVAAVPDHPMGDMEYQSVLGRLARRLAALGVKSVERAFDHLDAQGTGALRREDFLGGMARMQVRGISDSEASRLFKRLDADNDGVLVMQELRTALAACTQADAPFKAQEAWVRELFARIREAVERRPDLSPQDVFKKLAQEVRSPPGSGLGVDFAHFCQLLRSFRTDLQDGHLEYLWFMVDKDRNGLISFEEFSDIFSSPQALVQSAVASTAAGSGGMSAEYFGILAGRLLRRLRGAGLTTLEQVVRRFDQDGDGRLSRRELEAALVLDAPNLSQLERSQFVARMDTNNDGVITTKELEVALQQGSTAHTQAEQRAEAVFARIRGAILRMGQRPEAVFTGLCKGQTMMSKAIFEQLVQSFAADLPAQSVELMWQLVDKDSDGFLAYAEFQQHFVQHPSTAQVAAPTQTAAAQPAAVPSQCPSQAAAVHQPFQQQQQIQQQQQQPVVAAVQRAPAPVAEMSAEHFGILVGRLLRRLRAGGLATVEAAVRRFDQDGDGRLTRQELETALQRDAPNLSQQERAQFAAKMDLNNDGLISAKELELAFQQGGATYAQAQQRSEQVFALIRQAISRLGKSLEEVFAGLCKGGIMFRADFEQLVRGFAPSLPSQSAELMWQLCDKNNDGSLTLEEFRLHFTFQQPATPALPGLGTSVPTAAAPAATTAAVTAAAVTQPIAPTQPTVPGAGTPIQSMSSAQLAAVAQAPTVPLVQAAPAMCHPRTSQRPGDALVLGSIRRLIEREKLSAVDFFQRMDVNRDGRLSADEFAAGLVGRGLGVDRAELRKFFLQIDGATMGRLPIAKLAEAVAETPATLHAPQAAAHLSSPLAGGAAATIGSTPLPAAAVPPASANVQAHPVQPVASQQPHLPSVGSLAAQPGAAGHAAGGLTLQQPPVTAHSVAAPHQPAAQVVTGLGAAPHVPQPTLAGQGASQQSFMQPAAAAAPPAQPVAGQPGGPVQSSVATATAIPQPPLAVAGAAATVAGVAATGPAAAALPTVAAVAAAPATATGLPSTACSATSQSAVPGVAAAGAPAGLPTAAFAATAQPTIPAVGGAVAPAATTALPTPAVMQPTLPPVGTAALPATAAAPPVTAATTAPPPAQPAVGVLTGAAAAAAATVPAQPAMQGLAAPMSAVATAAPAAPAPAQQAMTAAAQPAAQPVAQPAAAAATAQQAAALPTAAMCQPAVAQPQPPQPSQPPAPAQPQAAQPRPQAAQTTAGQPDLLLQIREAIEQQGTSEAIAMQTYEGQITNGRPALSRVDFEQLARRFDPGLNTEAFNKLWQRVAEDASAPFMTFTQFCTHLCPAAIDQSLTALSTGKHLVAYLHRLQRAFTSPPRTFQQAFAPFDASRASALPLEDFLHACRSSGLNLSRLELEKVFNTMARKKAGAPQKIIEFSTLDFAIKSKAPPEAEWTQKQLVGINDGARASGVLLESVLAQEQEEAISTSKIREMFARHISLDKQQWATVIVFLDKQWDGRVLWRRSLQWAGVIAA